MNLNLLNKKPPIEVSEVFLKSVNQLTLTSFHLGVFLVDYVNTAFATDDLAVLITNLFAF